MWWARRDSNSHVIGRQNLNLVRLPIPPLALIDPSGECHPRTNTMTSTYRQYTHQSLLRFDIVTASRTHCEPSTSEDFALSLYTEAGFLDLAQIQGFEPRSTAFVWRSYNPLSYICNIPACTFLWQLEHRTTHFLISDLNLSELKDTISAGDISF